MQTTTPTAKKFPEMSPVEQPVSGAPSIVLCPGQGAQRVGMGKAWYGHGQAAKKVFDRADQFLGFKLSELCFEGPDEKLNRTDMGQLALYVTGCACYESLIETGSIGQVTATAGLSLGEFTALYIAGAFDFETGLKLVQVRGGAMQEAAESQRSGMVALVGADQAKAQEVCDQARGGDVLVAANFNCEGQVVISGSFEACERALEAAVALGVRATPLNVAGAFHSPLMQPAADRLAHALDDAQWQQPSVPVISNVTAQPHASDDLEGLKARLVEQLTSPVRWMDSVKWLIGNTGGQYVELAPGKVLSGLMRRIDRKHKVCSYAEPSS